MSSKLTNGERMVRIETSLNYLKDEIVKTNNLIKDYIIKHDVLHDNLNERINNLDSKFASKKIEQAAYYVLGVLFTTITGLIIYILTQN